MFRATFNLRNDRLGSNPQDENLMYMSCVGVFTDEMVRNRWVEIAARINLPAAAQSVKFMVDGGGREGGFLATGLGIVRFGRDLQVSVKQDDDRQIVNRDCRLPLPNAGEQDCTALIHSVRARGSGLAPYAHAFYASIWNRAHGECYACLWMI